MIGISTIRKENFATSLRPFFSRRPVEIVAPALEIPGITARAWAIPMIKASEKGIYFSKVVSIGNACDLAVTDFLDYFKVDEETAVIGGLATDVDSTTKSRAGTDRVRTMSKWHEPSTPI